MGKRLNLEVLSADGNELQEEQPNDESVVLVARYKDFSMLLTGDIGNEIEERLITEKAHLTADILKVGHHGSSSSSCAKFLRTVSARVAVISVGEGNMYGHPSSSTIARLRKAGAKIYRTDRNGDVTIKTDGATYSVYASKGR